MAASDKNKEDSTSPGDIGHTSTRAPTQLSVLLAGAGTPPLDSEQARLAPIRLWDAFVLLPDRARIFSGDERALFTERAEVCDPRHDAMARIIRAVAAVLRQRLIAWDSSHPGSELLRGVPALASPRIEGALSGYDFRRGGSAAYTARFMLGSPVPDVDPLDVPDAGVLRRFLALTTRGLMVDRGGARGGGAVVSDLGAVALALALMDLFANPRSALRAARVRLSKQSRIDDRDSARVRDVGHALREVLSHAVSSATTAGAAGRDLVKDTTLTPELMDHLAVALSRAVYDGLGPREEHPLVVTGAGTTEAFTVAPYRSSGDEALPGGPTLGLYDRIAFVALPYAPAPLRDRNEPEQRSAPRPSALDDATFQRARETLKSAPRPLRPPAAVASVLDAQVDATDPRHSWRRSTPAALPARVMQTIEQNSPGTHVVILVGPRSASSREVLDALATAMSGRWHVLAPHAAERILAIEPLEGGTQAGLQLRRADVTRWLDDAALRSVQWNAPAQCNIVVNASTLGDDAEAQLRTLCSVARDVGDRTDARNVLLFVGAPTYKAAADALAVFARQPDLESGALPLRNDAIWLVRTDAPLAGRADPRRAGDESMMVELAEIYAPPAIADLAARSALIPPDGRFRGRALRLAALPQSAAGGVAGARRTVERAIRDAWGGHVLRRTLQAGVASLSSARAALSAGLGVELAACARHEVSLLVAEWEGMSERAPALRLADIARGMLLEWVMAAHPRAAMIADEALAQTLSMAPEDLVEPALHTDALHSVALGTRAGGTLYARDESRASIPLGFVLRGGSADLYALVDIVVGPMPPRAVPAPHIEVLWRTAGDRDPSLGGVATLVAALHDTARRWTRETPARSVTREARASYSAVFDVAVDARLMPESVRVVVPLKQGTSETDAQALAVDLVAELAEASETEVATEWSARTNVDSRGPTAVALVGPMLLREFSARWARALRVLPRYFPTGSRGSPRYGRASAIATAAELGLATALLQERGIGPTSTHGRAVLSRLPAAATEHMTRVREVATMMPVRAPSADLPEWEVLERQLVLAWFLHANFCTSAAGRVSWVMADGFNVRPIVEQHIDRNAVRGWLQKKSSRPESVDQRVTEFLADFEPSVVVQA